MTGRRRVVVTGIGLVTPLGGSLGATVEALRRGDQAFAAPSMFDASGFAETRAAEVKDFDARTHFRVTKALKLADRATRFAVAAGAMALADARWPDGDESLTRLGVVVGTSGSDLQTRDLAAALHSDPERRSAGDIPFFAGRMLSGLNPLWLLVSLPNMSSAHVAIQLRANGPNSTIMTDWVAGSQAIGEAFEWIREGEADAVLAGGADSGLTPFVYFDYESAGLFGSRSGDDRTKPRFIPGEGGAILLLEERAHAIGRGATIRAELCAYAAASAPVDRCPLSRTMCAALTDAAWQASDVGGISMTSVFSDPYRVMEQQSIAAMFGGQTIPPPATEYTSRLGHTLGASGAIDAALSVELGNGPMLCNSVGFSGQAVTLAFRVGPEVAA